MIFLNIAHNAFPLEEIENLLDAAFDAWAQYEPGSVEWYEILDDITKLKLSISNKRHL